VLASLRTACQQQAPVPQSQGAYQELADANKSLAFDLLRKLQDAQADENIFFSPTSISMALSMANNGAAGDTYLEISEALGTHNMIADEVNEAYQSMHHDLENLDAKVKLKIANSTWTKDGFPIKPEFFNVADEYYESKAYTRDFDDIKTVDEINDWAADHTENKIKKVIDKISSDAVMFLMNAIYFKGDWQYKFDKSLTAEADFLVNENQQSTCNMMQTEADFAYYRGDQIQMVDLPYGNGAFSMSIVLPDEGYGLSQLIEDLDQEKWENWIKALNEQGLILQMPSLELEYSKMLKEELKALGMQKAFSRGIADFSHLTQEPVYIDFVKHDSYLKIDEKGTEAAAVTTVGFVNLSAGPQTPTMRVNRPYLLIIRERSTDNLLFVGKIYDPAL